MIALIIIFLASLYRVKFTSAEALPAFNTFILVYFVGRADFPSYRVDGANPFARAAAYAFLAHYGKAQKFAAAARGAVFVVYMVFVLVPEIAQGGKHRVRRSLPQTAKRGLLHGGGYVLELFYIPGFSFALGNAF
jgi:hypothetical protein